MRECDETVQDAEYAQCPETQSFSQTKVLNIATQQQNGHSGSCNGNDGGSGDDVDVTLCINYCAAMRVTYTFHLDVCVSQPSLHCVTECAGAALLMDMLRV